MNFYHSPCLREGKESSIVIVITRTIIIDVRGVTLPEEKRLQQLPHLLVTPVLAEYVSWVTVSWNVKEPHDASCNSLANPVEREGSMPFVQLGMWLC